MERHEVAWTARVAGFEELPTLHDVLRTAEPLLVAYEVLEARRSRASVSSREAGGGPLTARDVESIARDFTHLADLSPIGAEEDYEGERVILAERTWRLRSDTLVPGMRAAMMTRDDLALARAIVAEVDSSRWSAGCWNVGLPEDVPAGAPEPLGFLLDDVRSVLGARVWLGGDFSRRQRYQVIADLFECLTLFGLDPDRANAARRRAAEDALRREVLGEGRPGIGEVGLGRQAWGEKHEGGGPTEHEGGGPTAHEVGAGGEDDSLSTYLADDARHVREQARRLACDARMELLGNIAVLADECGLNEDSAAEAMVGRMRDAWASDADARGLGPRDLEFRDLGADDPDSRWLESAPASIREAYEEHVREDSIVSLAALEEANGADVAAMAGIDVKRLSNRELLTFPETATRNRDALVEWSRQMLHAIETALSRG